MIPRLLTVDDAAADPSFTHDVVSLMPGRLYHFVGILGPPVDGESRWRWEPAAYALIGVGRDVRTFQPRVIYQNADGELLVTGLEDWHRLFKLIPTLEDVTPPARGVLPDPGPHKIAGGKLMGIGDCRKCGAFCDEGQTLCPACQQGLSKGSD